MTTMYAPSAPVPYRLERRSLLLGRLLYVLLLLICVITFAASLYGKFVEGTSPCDWLYHTEWPECSNWFATLDNLHLTPAVYESYFLVWRLAGALPFFVLSLLLARRREHELRVLLLAGLLLVLAIAGTWFNPFWQWAGGLMTEENLPQFLVLIQRTLSFLLYSGLGLFAFLFPDGRFVLHWTRWVAGAWVLLAAGFLYFPDSPISFWSWPVPIPQLMTAIFVLIVIVAVIRRYQRPSTPVQRQQIKWISAGFLLLVLNFMLDFGVWELYPAVTDDLLIATARQGMFWDLGQDTLWYVSQILFGVCIGLAVFRHRLWDIDLILSRTLVYGVLTALVVALYILIVGGLSLLFQTQSYTLTGLVATGVIAVLFQPLLDRLQHGVDRLLYGERNDPAAVLTQLAHDLETANTPAVILPSLVQTIARTLKIPHTAIWLPVAADRMEPIAAWGAAADRVERIPLTYQDELIGNLVVAPRGPREQFNRHDRELLTSIAALTATTVRAVQLSDELRRSRQRIVTAREEERRRLRRDLHDGLGPQLASQTLGLDAIEHLMPTNPEKGYALLASLKAQAQEAVLDVRRLVYDLRPPALDDLGLIGALKQRASRYEMGSLRFIFDVPEALPELPAAVEIATYRIAQEAMTNVVRHAQATTCTLHLASADGHLLMEIRDNGRGLAQERLNGVGLNAMRERAAELNGQCVIDSLPEGGTQVWARLPLEVDDD